MRYARRVQIWVIGAAVGARARGEGMSDLC